MNHPYVSSNGSTAATWSVGAARLPERLREAWRRWQALWAVVADELHEQRLARDISAAYADLDRHTREDLGVDRRRC